ncbi:MAG: transglycosylase SLT domain-containing protein [Firmicutes bacterium]|nr:transglycosylase SLT domain-containing protein [Bacillota bacterium]
MTVHRIHELRCATFGNLALVYLAQKDFSKKEKEELPALESMDIYAPQAFDLGNPFIKSVLKEFLQRAVLFGDEQAAGLLDVLEDTEKNGEFAIRFVAYMDKLASGGLMNAGMAPQALYQAPGGYPPSQPGLSFPGVLNSLGQLFFQQKPLNLQGSIDEIIQQLKDELQRTLTDRMKFGMEQQKAQAEEKASEERLREVATKKQQVEGEKNQKEGELRSVESQKRETEGQLNQIRSRKNNLRSQEAQLRSQEIQLSARIIGLTVQVAALTLQIAAFRLQAVSLHATAAALRSNPWTAAAGEALEQQALNLDNLANQMEEQKNTLEQQKTEAESRKAETQSRIQQTGSQIQQLETNEKQLEQRLKPFEQKMKEIQSRLSAISNELAQSEKEYVELERRSASLKAASSQIESALGQIDNRAYEIKKKIEELMAKKNEDKGNSQEPVNTGAASSEHQSGGKVENQVHDLSRTKISDMMESAAQRFGVPPAFLKSIAWKESQWNSNKVGENGESYGLTGVNKLDYPDYSISRGVRDPQYNIDFAAGKLKEQLSQNKYDTRGAVARYKGNGPEAEAYVKDIFELMDSQPWRYG